MGREVPETPLSLPATFREQLAPAPAASTVQMLWGACMNTGKRLEHPALSLEGTSGAGRHSSGTLPSYWAETRH